MRLHNINKLFLILLLSFIGAPIVLTSCSKNDEVKIIESNKKERNKIKEGNEKYGKRNFSEALARYREAMDANPNSEVAKLNYALAAFQSNEVDSTTRRMADSLLVTLSTSALDPEVGENAIYNRSNILVYIGDELKAQSETDAEPGMAQELSQQSTEMYKAAIEGYKELLRRKPGDLRVTQNLRVTQMKLPPESDGGGSNDNQEDQQNQEQEQEQEQQQQQQQQPQADALNALQKREAQTRKKQNEPVTPVQITTDKPW